MCAMARKSAPEAQRLGLRRGPEEAVGVDGEVAAEGLLGRVELAEVVDDDGLARAVVLPEVVA